MENRPPLVLLADDEPVSRQLLSDSLRRSGFEVRQAADGCEALRLATEDTPDLLVLDFEMPRMDGVQTCRELRASERQDLKTLPVIMLTAYAGEAEELTCLQAGANDFVTKPVSREILAARIHTQLRLRSMSDELRRQNEELARWRVIQEADLAAARATQRVIIPSQPPSVQGWAVQTTYQPVIEVGGDAFGWRPASDGRYWFWLADATGHGAAAALFTALAAQLFRQACDTEANPSAVLHSVNQEFNKVFHGRAFMTAGCALISPDGELLFAGAGHPPLLIRRSDGSVESVGPHATVIGLPSKEGLSDSRSHLQPGDVALLYSDGMVSFRDPHGERFLPAELPSAVGAIPPGDAFLQRLLARLQGSSDGQAADDDIAAIALQKLPTA
jgi:serine phosphatase RsbU (regulator of sigma subunit)